MQNRHNNNQNRPNAYNQYVYTILLSKYYCYIIVLCIFLCLLILYNRRGVQLQLHNLRRSNGILRQRVARLTNEIDILRTELNRFQNSLNTVARLVSFQIFYNIKNHLILSEKNK
jgi:hypothetical protein